MIGDHAAAWTDKAILRWIESEPLWSRAVHEIRASGCSAYLVGGSVRDALREQSGEDMDLAVDGNALALGRWLADRLGGAFFPMDRERDVARIVFPRGGRAYHIDLAGLRGRSILQDLAARDFTINALGLALTEPLGPLLDPTGGWADLQMGVVRMAYAEALVDDPLRMLRALRLSGSLGLALEPVTYAQIAAHCALIQRASSERVRDELMQLLALCCTEPLRQALDLGLLPLLLPTPNHASAMRGIQWLDALYDQMGVNGALSYRARLDRDWGEFFADGRPRRALVALAALVADAPAEELGLLGARLRLSGREQEHLRLTLAALNNEIWAVERPHWGPLDAHRYYRLYQQAGVDAAALAACRPTASANEGRFAAYLLWAWFEAHAQIVKPPALLRGDDLLNEFALTPGPRIGALLEGLAEAQASGRIATGDQARAYVREHLALERSKGCCV